MTLYFLELRGYDMITWRFVLFSEDAPYIRLLFSPLKPTVSFWYVEQSAEIPLLPHLCHFLTHNSFTNVVYLIIKHNFHIFHFIIHNSNLVNKLELQFEYIEWRWVRRKGKDLFSNAWPSQSSSFAAFLFNKSIKYKYRNACKEEHAIHMHFECTSNGRFTQLSCNFCATGKCAVYGCVIQWNVKLQIKLGEGEGWARHCNVKMKIKWWKTVRFMKWKAKIWI